MPARSVVKHYTEDSYYHIYNRGVESRDIFLDDQDFTVFQNLLKRHLSRSKELNSRGNEYESYAGRVELLSFCLTPTHFHLLFYLSNDTKAISELMRRISGSYTAYFNKKYIRIGHLFRGVYKASQVYEDSHLLSISRYIHRNPDDYTDWQYSSLQYYIGDWKSDWVVPDKVYKLYEWGMYEKFLHDHEDSRKAENELIGYVLANME